MVKSRRPISFIATSEPQEALAFYGEVLGLRLLEDSPYALVFADGETMLRVQIVAEFSPAAHTAHGWQVVDIEQEIVELTSKGAEFLAFDQIPQSAEGIWTTPGGDQIAWFKDRSGNVLSLTQYAVP